MRVTKAAPLSACLAGYGLNPPKLAELLGVSRQSGYNYMADPGLLRVRDLKKLVRAGVDPDELARAIFRKGAAR